MNRSSRLPESGLQEQPSFTDILTSSSLTEISSPLSHHFLQGKTTTSSDKGTNKICAQHFRSFSRNSPSYHITSCINLQGALSMCPKIDVQQTESFAQGATSTLGCHSIGPLLAWLQESPSDRCSNILKPSTSSVSSEPSSTVDNVDVSVPFQRLSQQSANLKAGDMQKIKDNEHQSCQTSPDEGSSKQRGLTCMDMGGDACQTPSHTYTGDESCPLSTNCGAIDPYRIFHPDEHHAIILRRPARKRKRNRIRKKSSEEAESQRMTHIAVERNRRKQMNDQLNVLRTLMPVTYIERGDQASIIGGAVDFVKELENVLQALQREKNHRHSKLMSFYCRQEEGCVIDRSLTSVCTYDKIYAHVASKGTDVSVTVNGICALVKVLVQKLPRQLLKITLSIEKLHLRIMHLNMTTIDASVLYSLNLEVQEDALFRCASGIAYLMQSVFNIEDQSLPS